MVAEAAEGRRHGRRQRRRRAHRRWNKFNSDHLRAAAPESLSVAVSRHNDTGSASSPTGSKAHGVRQVMRDEASHVPTYSRHAPVRERVRLRPGDPRLRRLC